MSRIAMVLLSLASPLYAAQWALLVGVNQYQVINSLRGCENDVRMVKDVLVSKLGFPEANIKVLLNSEATANGIRQAIEDWLVAQSQPEDYVYFHFSGHGSQVRDREGDENDGKDELICPTNMKPGDRSTILTDDQLDELFGRIQAQNLVVVLDACHSGTGTRDLSLCRPRFAEFEPGLESGARGIEAAPAARTGAQKLVGSGGMDGSARKRITLSGCRPDQTSADAFVRDGFYAGAFTYYLCKNLKKAPRDMTYHQLMEQVARDVLTNNYMQTPQLDGDKSQPVFGAQGGVVERPYVVVRRVVGHEARLNAGKNANLTVGSIFAVFPPGEKAFQGPGIGRIRVTSVDETIARSQVLDDAVIEPDCRAKETMHRAEVGKLKLFLSDVSESLQANLASLGFVAVVDGARSFDHRLEMRDLGGGVQGALTTDGVLGPGVTGADAAAVVEGLRPQLQNAYALKVLANLDNPNPPFKVEVWANRSADPAGLEQAGDEKLVQARLGDAIRFNFRSQRDCYLTMVNLGTSGKIVVLFPNRYQPDGRILAGKVYRTETPGEMPFRIRARGPAGRELVKVIATIDPLTLPSLRMGQAGPEGTRAIPSGSDFVQQLMLDLSSLGSAREATRDLVAEALPEGELLLPTEGWATDYLVVETTPAE
jgi:hypothetical protein